jgi:hypothetical protein
VTRRLDIAEVQAAREEIATGKPAEALFDPEVAKYRDDPVGYARDVLGIEPWSRQAEVLQAVAEHPRVGVRSGHKVGKSTNAAILALWWVSTRAQARVIFTSAVARQVRTILWREMRRLYRGARRPIGGELFEQPDRGLEFADGREVLGFTSDEAEKFSGISGPNLLFILDEASGIAEAIYESTRGSLAGGGRLVLFSNPTRTSGFFFDAFNRRSDFWKLIHISSAESPNITGEAEIPGLATAEWMQDLLDEWGAESPLFQVRVLGDFPVQAANAVIGLALVEAAVARWQGLGGERARMAEGLGVLQLGCDPARFGDDESVCIARRGNVVLEVLAWRGLDTVQLAARVLEVARRLRRSDERPVVAVDVIGIGAGVADQIKQATDVELREINVGEASSVATYSRTRDELWFALRDWLRADGASPNDAKLAGELVAPTYGFEPSGKLKVESKDEMRKRLKRSPDRADALALAVYEKRVKRTCNYDVDAGGGFGTPRFPDRPAVDDWQTFGKPPSRMGSGS